MTHGEKKNAVRRRSAPSNVFIHRRQSLRDQSGDPQIQPRHDRPTQNTLMEKILRHQAMVGNLRGRQLSRERGKDMIMAEHANVALLRQGYSAYSNGDLETLDRLIDEDVVWHVLGRNQLSGDYKGTSQVFEFFGRLRELSNDTNRITVQDLLANDRHGIALVDTTASRGGKTYSGDEVHVSVLRDGKVAEFWDYAADPYEQDAFWA
jgi:ketosteroid isomerase-like protein